MQFSKRFLFLLFIAFCFASQGQATFFYQAQLKGGVTGCGYGPPYSLNGTGTLTLSIAPGSTIYKAWLFAGRQGEAEPATVTLDTTDLTFDSTNQVSLTFNSIDYGGPSAVHAIDVTNLINPAVNTYSLAIPTQQSTSDRFQDFYLYVVYANSSLPQVSSVIYLNSANMQPSVLDTLNLPYPMNTADAIGLAVYLGYACDAGDAEGVAVNGITLGQVYGPNSNSGDCAGPFGDFGYQSGTLTGILDGNPDQVMNGPDALSNIAALVTNCSRQVIVDFSHANSDNAVWGIFLTYGSAPSSFNMDTAICLGTQLQLVAPGGGSVVWTPAAGLPCDTCSTITVSPASTSTYVAKISGGACGSAIDSITVNVSSAASLSVPGTSICPGNVATLNAVPTISGGTFLWTPGGYTTSSISVLPDSTTTYQVIYSLANCGADTATATVTIDSTPRVNISGPTIICFGDTALLVATPSISGGAYQWAPNGQTTSSIVVQPFISSTYEVFYTLQGCGTGENSLLINVDGALEESLTGSPAQCGNANGSIDAVTVLGISPYYYSLDSVQYQNSGLFSNLSAGLYTVYVKDSAGCTSLDTITITSTQSATITISADTNQVCSGDSARICAASGFSSYNWNVGDTGMCIYAPYTGNYYVTATTANNCTAISNQVHINVLEPTPVTVSVSGDTLICYPEDSYQWYLNGVPIAGADSQKYVATQSGIYLVVVTDNLGCPVSSSQITITSIAQVAIAQVKVYPNPLDDGGWRLVTDETLLGADVEIMDNNSRIVYRDKIKATQTDIDLEVASGIYLMRITYQDNVAVLKLVKR